MPEKEHKLTPRLHEALEIAYELFGQEARKQSQVPYLAHLLSVCAMVQMDGGNEDEAIAALLHDVLEDKADQIRPEEIKQQFGEHVLEIIRISSDTPRDYAGGKKPPWKKRKKAYLEHIYQTDASLLRVTIADKVDNARAILADHHRVGEEIWNRFNAGKKDQQWYFDGCLKAFDAAGFNGPLLEELRKLVNQLIAL